MKRIFMWGMTALLSGIIMLLNPMDVHAETYYWAEGEETTEGGETIKVAGWYKDAPPSSTISQKLDKAPENLNLDDTILCRFRVF